MEAAWRACDAFWEMDRRHAGQITRQEYFAALAEAETVAQLRLIRKARLDERFQRSVVPLSLGEFLQLLWPGASAEDAAAIRRWAQLREARKVLGSSSFRGAESELRRIFERLDGRGEGQVMARDIVRAQILGPEELRKLLKRDCCALDAVLDVDAFRTHVWPFLKARFVTRETITKMKKEEEAMYDSAFRMGLGGTGSSS